MNIEKIKNYNHNLLAVLGTILVIIAVVGLISITYFTISEIRSDYKYRNQDDGILSNEKIEQLQEENKRQQLISYEIPRLVDTLNLIYIIPVSHKTLNDPEISDDGLNALLNMSSTGDYEVDNRYSRQYYGDFNNLLIYDYNIDLIKKLFTDRVNFRNIQIEYLEDDILILFKASSEDTYKDGVINQRDYRSLFLYSIKDKKLIKIQLENTDVYNFSFVENSKDLLIVFGLDYNEDGEFDEYREPSVIKKYDFKSGELQNIVSDEINKELQMKLEGKNNESPTPANRQ